MTPSALRLGTRKSALALAQSGMIARDIGPDVELVHVVTEGDRLVDVPLQGTLAKGYFTEALESGLREGHIDLAVHSLKDLPVADAPGLVLGAIPARESVADLLLIRIEAWDPEALGLPLRPGARVGAASLRRQALALSIRPDVIPEFLRGNVTTRVSRLREGRFDAIVLAEAGVRRLGALLDLSNTAEIQVVRLLPEHWPPAPGQGALGIQCRAGDRRVLERLAHLHDPDTAAAVGWERAALRSIGGGCATPFAAWWRGQDGVLGMAGDAGFRVARGVTDVGRTLGAWAGGAAGEPWPARVWEPYVSTDSDTPTHR